MKLKLVKDLEILKDYFVDAGFGQLIPQYQAFKPFQRLYVITSNGENIGFVEIHYLQEREDLFIARQIFESVFNTEKNKIQLVKIIENKAKELGAKIIMTKLLEKDALLYGQEGFETLNKIYTLKKEI